MQRDILLYPNRLLAKETEQITNFTAQTAQLVIDMFEAMETNKGVGLAAPQIGILKSVFTYKIDNKEGYMINPVLLEVVDDSEQFQLEQCLSFPDIQLRVSRLAKIIVGYNDTECREQVLEAEGLLAVIIQHEMDHLEGKVLIDYLPRMKKDIIKRKIKKLAKQRKRME